MNRPYIICHMTTSIDGKVTGCFLETPESASAVEVYYQINRDYKTNGFAEAEVVDEISLVVNLVVADTEAKPLFMKSKLSACPTVAIEYGKHTIGLKRYFLEEK